MDISCSQQADDVLGLDATDLCQRRSWHKSKILTECRFAPGRIPFRSNIPVVVARSICCADTDDDDQRGGEHLNGHLSHDSAYSRAELRYSCKHHQNIINAQPTLRHCVACVNPSTEQHEHDKSRCARYSDEERHTCLRIDIIAAAKSDTLLDDNTDGAKVVRLRPCSRSALLVRSYHQRSHRSQPGCLLCALFNAFCSRESRENAAVATSISIQCQKHMNHG